MSPQTDKTTYKSKITIKFGQTDMAGICYFNNATSLFHDQYEEFVQSCLCPKKQWFDNPEWIFPIRRIETDYLKPMLVFEEYEITIRPIDVGGTSFTLETLFEKAGALHCKVTSRHVCVDKKTFKPRALPEEIAKTLAP